MLTNGIGLVIHFVQVTSSKLQINYNLRIHRVIDERKWIFSETMNKNSSKHICINVFARLNQQIGSYSNIFQLISSKMLDKLCSESYKYEMCVPVFMLNDKMYIAYKCTTNHFYQVFNNWRWLTLMSYKNAYLIYGVYIQSETFISTTTANDMFNIVPLFRVSPFFFSRNIVCQCVCDFFLIFSLSLLVCLCCTCVSTNKKKSI